MATAPESLSMGPLWDPHQTPPRRAAMVALGEWARGTDAAVTVTDV